MKPLLSESEDKESLWALGRASVQIIHDLKNQLNGLKLYATFLRKRIEKSERPADELQTVNKLIAGIDRTAADLSILGRYGQPIVLKLRSGIDLQTVLRDVISDLTDSSPSSGASGKVLIESANGPMVGEFDSAVLGDALKSISIGAMKMAKNNTYDEPLLIQLRDEHTGTQRNCVIDWQVFDSSDHDPFASFAGSEGIRMSLAAKAIQAHGGSAERRSGTLRVRLPLGPYLG